MMFRRLRQFQLSSTQQTVLSQTGVQILGKAVTAIASIIVIRLIASKSGLGSDGYASYILITSYLVFFYIILDFGYNAIYVQRGTEQPEREAEIFSQILSLRLVVAGILVLAGTAILAFLRPDVYTAGVKVGIIFALATVFFQALVVSCNGWFQIKLRYNLSVLASIISALVNVALTFLLLKLGLGVTGVIVAYIIEYALMGLIALGFVARSIPIRLTWNWSEWRSMTIAAFPIGLVIALNILYFRSDQFLLAQLHFDPSVVIKNKEAVAIYGLPYQAFENVLALPAFLLNAVYPLMVHAILKSQEVFRKLVWQTLWASVAGSLALVAVIWVLAPLYVNLQTANNTDFNQSVLVLRLLSLGVPTFFATNVLNFALITLKKQQWIPVIYILAGVINISLNLWLIPHYTYVAAAITTSITELFILVLLAILFYSVSARQRQSTEVIEGVIVE